MVSPATLSFPTVNFFWKTILTDYNFFGKRFFQENDFSGISTFLIRKGFEKCSTMHKPKLGLLHLFLKLFFGFKLDITGDSTVMSSLNQIVFHYWSKTISWKNRFPTLVENDFLEKTVFQFFLPW
jgi:hypothetical protein